MFTSISSHGNMPFEILNGSPNTNILDAINSWYLVNEIKHSVNMPAGHHLNMLVQHE